MTPRIDHRVVAPGATRTLLGLETYVHESGLDPTLLHLIKCRASQINGCAYCLDMHTKDARAGGETEQRLYALPAWRDAPFYSSQERAALAWTEAVTRIDRGPVSDRVYNQARQHFTERDLVDLTVAVIAINSWNRLNVALGAEAGTYQVGARIQPVVGGEP